MDSLNHLEEVSNQFEIIGEVKAITPVTFGHIHKSFRVRTIKGDYFLQQINNNVFKNVEALMSNIELVTDHLSSIYSGTQYEVARVIKSKKNGSLVIFKDEYWRIFEFKTGYESKNIPESSEEIFEGAKAFGTFTSKLTGLSPDLIKITIPKFHSFNHRLEQLKLAARQCDPDLLEDVATELHLISDMSGKLLKLEDAWKNGSIPTRITHNDTKFNNILFKEAKAKCVVDLDTVMPGILHFDLGDGLRTTASRAKEDEKDLEKIIIEPDRYDAFERGYLEGIGVVSEIEQKYLDYSAGYMTFMVGVRFLTDYLNGNVYFSYEYADQNLDRAKCQLHLAQLFEDFVRNR